MRFLFTCGGTAGHINPAVGVAGRLLEILPDAEFLFIGAEGMMEMELVPREGFNIRGIQVGNLSRSLSLSGVKHNVKTMKKLLRGSAEAKRILKEFSPDAAVGTGGYVCYPVLREAHKLGIPTLVHESNAVPGLTTKLLARSVDCVMVGFENAKENYPAGANVVLTGTPVRTGFNGSSNSDAGLTRARARKRLGLPEDRPLLVSVWGSLGSDHINGLMPEFLKLVCEKQEFCVIHSAGKRGYAKLASALDAVCGPEAARKAKGADCREYVYDMPLVMAAADLVMCRSGASTLGELAALGTPALLVPSPNVTNHHQEKNARLLEAAGAAEVLLEGGFDAAGLYDAASKLLADGARRAKMSGAMRAAGAPDAAERIADLILGYVK